MKERSVVQEFFALYLRVLMLDIYRSGDKKFVIEITRLAKEQLSLIFPYQLIRVVRICLIRAR